MNKVTIGADPEVFLKRGDTFIPAIGLIGGTKKNPKKCGIGFIQEDNVMPEFNIPPSTTATTFSNRIGSMLRELEKIASKHQCTLEYKSWAAFDPQVLRHPQAQMIGCDPDYNAWTMEQNARVNADMLGNIRVAAGHVHIGFNCGSNPASRNNLVKWCDLYLGVPSILMEDDGNIRRKYYGKAGAYRPKPYGVEYRVLGNWWIQHESYRKWVFNNTMSAVSLITKGIAFDDRLHSFIIDAINNQNKSTAKMFCDKYNITIPTKV